MSTRNPANSKQPFRWSLSLLIACVISFLLIALGGSITYYTYENEKQAVLKNTGKIFNLTSIQTEEKLSNVIHSVERFVAMSSALKTLGIGRVEELSLFLPYFKESFVSIPWMESFYVGYDDGSFYMIEAIRDNELIRQATSAPDRAAYRVKLIYPESEGRQKFFFFDSDLSLLETRQGAFDGYDPRKRKWYSDAKSVNDTVITRPYLFFTTGEIGITLAHSLQHGDGVVGADSALLTIAQLIRKQKLTPSTQIVLMDAEGRIILSSDESDLLQLEGLRKNDGNNNLHVADLSNQAANVMYQKSILKNLEGGRVIEVDGRKWFGHARQMDEATSNRMYLVIGSPFEELMVDVYATRQRNVLIMFLMVLAALCLGVYISRRIAKPLQALSLQAESVRDFKLTTPFTVRSRIFEVGQLADSMTIMQSAINRFVEIARALSAEKQMDTVIAMIVKEAQSVTGADGGAIGLVSDDGKEFNYVLVRNTQSGIHCVAGDVPVAPIMLEQDVSGRQSVEVGVVRDARTKVTEDIGSVVSDKYSNIRKLHEKDDYSCHSLLVIPLLNRQDEVIGLLHLVNARDCESGEIVSFSEEKTAYVQALASNAALALDNNRLIRAQKELFDSFVRLIAGAIDTKSPYTGGHCQRVPVISRMLADAASIAETPPFDGFTLTEDERYELFVASWLHDCGKVTTPEYVVDKATKLETIYNRIHEIRTRFEVLRRDADICYYKGLVENPENERQLAETRQRFQQKLLDDFAFVAECNVGGEFMAAERIERLQEVGGQSWQRYFDNRLGLSSDEGARMDMESEISYPVHESLLADKEEHILPRLDAGNPYNDNPLAITMPVPEYRYNLGEIYNLSIAKGTLSSEERYKINDHTVQTIEMLNKLPFPKEIRRVPDWAGNHHEKLDGSGYPRSLTAEQLSIPERIMAVADIFEALTAADRPYKTPKKLSSCIRIMSFMRNDGHICPDLFELFLRSGIYRDYAEKYMRPEQIDEVKIEEYFSA